MPDPPRAFALPGRALRGVRRLVYTRLVLTTVRVDELAARPVRPGDDVRLLTPQELDDFVAFRPGSRRDLIERRLAAGHECMCVWEAGEIVSAVWLRFDVMWLPELHDVIPLPPGTAYGYDSYTARADRNRGLVKARAPHTARHLGRRGYAEIRGYVRAENAAGLAATWASGSHKLGWIVWVHVGPLGVEVVQEAARRRTRLRTGGHAPELS